MMMTFTLGLASAGMGFVFYLFLYYFVIPSYQKRDLTNQRKEMLQEASRQRKRILEEQSRLQEGNLQLLQEDLDDEISLKEEGFKQQELELQEKSQKDGALEEKVAEREQEVLEYEEKVKLASRDLLETKKMVEAASEKTLDKMCQVAGAKRAEALERSRRRILDEKQVESLQNQKAELELLNSISNKRAHRMLDRVLSRYSPEFYWPKPINIVDVPKSDLYEKLEASTLLQDLAEYSGVSISLMADEDRPSSQSIKVVGGYGVSKEASRQALDRLLKEGKLPSWKRLSGVYDACMETLHQEAKVLGKQAVNQLGLEGIHPELQKLVGALNWRTSYRQNQWYHTVEVATLAGILAHEMGEDPDVAKRVGLLHDVGKVLDYGINASHAVISGDYADRYGESRIICDTVMSHHADLVLESPMAYILQTADCLSGARPGARVNLEEGYQIRLSAIQDAVYSFPGVGDVAIMNGGREVHIQVINRKVAEKALPDLAKNIAAKIEEMVNYPGKIKVMVTRTFESVKVA